MVAWWLVGTDEVGVLLMGMTADWHLQDFDVVDRVQEYDPLTDPAYSPPLPPIDLSTDQGTLREYLGSLLSQEASLFDAGVTCPIKDKDDTTCLACPVSAARDFGIPKGQLCRVGQEQERVATVLVAQRGL